MENDEKICPVFKGKKNYEGQCPRGGVNAGKVEFCDTHPISFI